MLAFSTVAATEEIKGFLHSLPSLPSRVHRVLYFWPDIGQLESYTLRVRLL
jgi:hypothetical protein